MTIRECARQVCKENGMTAEETEQFLEFADANNISGGKDNSNSRHLEELSEESRLKFFNAMRNVVPRQVSAWRYIMSQNNNDDQQSISA